MRIFLEMLLTGTSSPGCRNTSDGVVLAYANSYHGQEEM